MLGYAKDFFSAEMLEPGYLWLLPVATTLVVLHFLRSRDRTTVLRMICFCLVIVALSDPVVKKQESREEIAALVDVSKSVPLAGRRAFAEQLSQFLRADQKLVVNLIPFAQSPLAEPIKVSASESATDIAEQLDQSAEKLDGGDTNIGAAISQTGGGSSILLLSDGFETAGDALQAARAAGEKGVRIFPLIPEESLFRSKKVSISSLFAPLVANSGDLADVRVTVRNDSDDSAEETVELWFDETKLVSRTMSIPPGEEKLIMGKTPPTEGGLHRLRAVIKGGEELHRWISFRSKGRILLLSGTNDDARVLRQLLTLKGYALEDLVADGNRPIPTTFENYTGVIFNNVAERQLPKGYLAALKTFVERGGGLLLVGGDRSYGLGGYIGTPLETISPLKFVPPQTTKRRLNAAVVLVIDKSRSMSFDNKIDGARSAALLAIEAMKDEDSVAVIGFDETSFTVIPLKPVSEVKGIAEQRLRNLTAFGKTDLLPALAEARRQLTRSNASRKHIIVLSDGKVPPAGNQYEDELLRLREEGITVSGVALGADADAPFMQMVSQMGRGAFYHTLNAARLPEIFVHDIKVTTGEKTMKEQKEFPVGLGTLKSTNIERYPPIRGFVQTQPKRDATLELLTKESDTAYPLLASWRVGSGKVIAFASDANGRWSLPWLQWEGFSKFWSGLVENIEQDPTSASGQLDFDLRYNVVRKMLMLDLAVFDDKLRSEGSPRLSSQITMPGGEVRSISFLPQRKGRFIAHVENARPGDYQVSITYGAVKLPPLALTLPGAAFGEIPGKGVDVQNLASLAYETNGVINPGPKDVASAKHVSETYVHLYVPLAVLGFLLILIEAFIREFGVRMLSAKRLRAILVPYEDSGGVYEELSQSKIRRAIR